MEKHSLFRLLQSVIISIFLFVAPAASFSPQADPAREWHLLYLKIRDGLISKEEARSQLRLLEGVLRDLYRNPSMKKEEGPLCFPLKRYGASAIGGKEGSGYRIQGYDFFDGNRHKGHPGHDLFIRDKDQDGLDDDTGKPVNVLSASSGIVLSINLDWAPSSPLRGGNYIWIYDPGKSQYYYYAHLNEIFVTIGQGVTCGEKLGTVGRTGTNAYPKRSPTHLHFTVHQSMDGYPKPINPYKELIARGSKNGDRGGM